MGLLTVCAKYYEGVFWLVVFYVALITQPMIYTLLLKFKVVGTKELFPSSTIFSRFRLFLNVLFVMAFFYVSSVLPCGRFYYDKSHGFSGSTMVKLSYQYILFYLVFIQWYQELYNYLSLLFIKKINTTVNKFL